MPDDRNMVAATLRGDLAAFEQLIRKYQQPLIASAYYLTNQAEDAQDLVQETLVEAYQRLATLRDGAKLRAFLYTILRFKCCHWLSRRRNDLPLDACTELPAAALFDDGELQTLLARLPLPDREILVARYVQELSYPDPACRMDDRYHSSPT